MTKPIALSLMPALLVFGACSSAREQFDCKPGEGIGCKSISQVNQIIDQETQVPPKDSSLPLVDLKAPSQKEAQGQSLRLWVPPFKDPKGYGHEGKYISITNPVLDSRRAQP